MTSQSTRSSYGATYVSIENQPANVAEGVGRARQKALALTHLIGPRPIAEAVAANLDPAAVNTPGFARMAKGVLGYVRNGDFEALVSSLRPTPPSTLRKFGQHWVRLETRALKQAVESLFEAGASGSGSPNDPAGEASAAMRVIGATPAGEQPSPMASGLNRIEPARLVRAATAMTALRSTVEGRRMTAVLDAISAPPRRGRSRGEGNVVFMRADLETGVAREKMLCHIEDRAEVRVRVAESLFDSIEIQPVGLLMLERLDFTPLGYVRGELVYSMPLAPGEKITVSHREWTTTTEEFAEQVETLAEEERERAISEKTELSESSEKEKETSQRAEASVEASYSGAGFSVTASGGYEWEENKSAAQTASTKRNRELTDRAASRSKKQHKIDFKVSREAHTEDEQIRTVENTSESAVRWDFHRLMQKWQVDLFQIDARLTYDIVIPEPGEYLLRRYEELVEIDEVLASGDPFDIETSEIGEANWFELAVEYGAEVPPPPARDQTFFFEASASYVRGSAGRTEYLRLELPEGYGFHDVRVLTPDLFHGREDRYRGFVGDRDTGAEWDAYYSENMNAIFGTTRPGMVSPFAMNSLTHFPWRWWYVFKGDDIGAAPGVLLRVEAKLTREAFNAWRIAAWTAIRDGARAQWISRSGALQDRRRRLLDELTSKDSLKLRQMEREEIMKSVLRWTLGPDFEFYPDSLRAGGSIHDTRPVPLDYVDAATGTLRDESREAIMRHGRLTRFLQQAIEWENVNWIAYPYFWTMPGRWHFKQTLDHPDFQHRNFLRAGAARVVLTIRPGYERDWLELMEGETLPDTHPYLTLAEELRAQASTAFAYTPNPNRDRLIETGERIDRWFEFTPTGALDIEAGGVLDTTVDVETTTS